ncbi:MAG: protein kinase [Acidobacteriota bacterium]
MMQASSPTISHYRLVEKIGEGGMGVVWKAKDTVLGRTVAVKLLPAEESRDQERRRLFLQEARAASSLSDARIVQVYEFGRQGDLDFIVMEYVEGKPLSRILHGRPLPADKVAFLGEQVARGLARAHRKNLLHRDLKPANILVTADGDVKIVDFGLATLFEGNTAAGTEAPTRPLPARAQETLRNQPTPAPIVGTIAYMAPEQARGDRLDARSDIFSLGVVLYEMTTGERPFSGVTSAELLREIRRGRARPVRERVPQVPLELDRIVQKALAPNRPDRYQTMEDLAVDLKRLGRELETGSSPSYEDLKERMVPSRRRRWIGSAMAAAVAIAGILALLDRRMNLKPPAAAMNEHTILILPLEVHGQEDGAPYVGRAFAEALAVELAQAPNLHLLPVPDPAPVGNAARVAAARDGAAGRLITGALTREGSVIHASLTFIDVAENRILGGVREDAQDADLARLSSMLGHRAGRELGAVFSRLYDAPWHLTGGPKMAASPELAEALGAHRRADTPAALAASKRLVETFPAEVDALVLRTFALEGAWDADPSVEHQRELEKSLDLLERADPENPYIEKVRVAIQTVGRPRESIERYTRLLARDDLTPAARAWILRYRSFPQVAVGDLDAALNGLAQAIALDPVEPWNYFSLAVALRMAGRLDEALAYSRQAIALAPAQWRMQQRLGIALGDLGRDEESIKPLARACELSRAQSACAQTAIALQRAGRPEEAASAAGQAAALTASRWGAYNLACYHSLAGHRAQALEFLRQARRLGFASTLIARDPDLASLHGDPEFEAMVADIEKRIGKP